MIRSTRTTLSNFSGKLRFRDGLDNTVGLTVEIKAIFSRSTMICSLILITLCLTMHSKYKRKLDGDNLLLCQEFLIFDILKRSDSTVRQCFVEFYVHRRCNISSSVKKSGKFSQLSENVFLVQFRGQNAACHIPVNLRFSYETVEFIL